MVATIDRDGSQKIRATGRGAGITATGIAFGYGNRLVLSDVDLTVKTGDMVAVVGPNGSGKTTLLRVLSGTLWPQQGKVWLDGEPLGKLSRSTIARQVAVLPQDTSVPFAFTVQQMVLMGRIPYLRPLVGESRHDHEVARRAMLATGTAHLADRVFNELSGGERQRVLIAMALAQQPRLLLLDEPMVHLDVSHQIEVLELVQGLNREEGITVVAVMHDLNLAAMYFDRVVLVNHGQIVASGVPSDVFSPELVQRVFRTTVRVVPHPTAAVPYLVFLPQNGNRDAGAGNGH